MNPLLSQHSGASRLKQWVITNSQSERLGDDVMATIEEISLTDVVKQDYH